MCFPNTCKANLFQSVCHVFDLLQNTRGFSIYLHVFFPSFLCFVIQLRPHFRPSLFYSVPNLRSRWRISDTCGCSHDCLWMKPADIRRQLSPSPLLQCFCVLAPKPVRSLHRHKWKLFVFSYIRLRCSKDPIAQHIENWPLSELQMTTTMQRVDFSHLVIIKAAFSLLFSWSMVLFPKYNN